MSTEIAIEDTRFFIDGRPTYEGRKWEGRPLDGLLMNARMVQAIFDDQNPETRKDSVYPDTGVWDPERNTDEFIAALPEYRRHGLLAFTVGLQGGGSIFRPDHRNAYECNAYEPDGSFRPAYFDRLKRTIEAADQLGMVIIVSFFYIRMIRFIRDEAIIKRITESVCEWLLETGYRNVILDIVPEVGVNWGPELMHPHRVHELIEIAQQTRVGGRRLLVSASSGGLDFLPEGRWLELEDIHMPHGNGATKVELVAKLRRLKASDEFCRKPCPIVINEDSQFIDRMEAVLREGVSWGFYTQGYGSCYRDQFDWTTAPRESRVEDLSGYQTLPVNWGINTDIKRRFFNRLLEITGGTT